MANWDIRPDGTGGWQSSSTDWQGIQHPYSSKTKPYVYNNNPSPLYTMGSFHMIGDDNWEPQRTNNFEIHIYGLADGAIRTPHKGIKVQDNPEKILTLSVASFGSINTNFNTIEIPYGNTVVKFAGVPRVENSTLVVNDYIGKGTERLIAAWQSAVGNFATQKVGMASNYKKSAAVIETAPDGSHYRVWKLFGCFPSSVEYQGYDYNSNSVRQITMTLTYDCAIPLDNWTSGAEVHSTRW